MASFFSDLLKSFSNPLFSLGNTTVSVWTILYFIIFIWLLFYGSSKFTKFIVNNLLAKSRLEMGVRISLGMIIRYIILTVGFLIVLQTVGINLDSVTILFGAIGVGLGFGLQNIINNFVSGLIVLFERPIKVGDLIEVAGSTGIVEKISMRATRVITSDNISIIVPNSEFISSTIINWSHTDKKVRLNFPVSVSYKEVPEKVKALLLEAAGEHPGVVTEPQPDVLFSDFGENALKFNLRVWTIDYVNSPGTLKSDIYYKIFDKFKAHGIEIPFPQRVVHLQQG